tara:strand:+ start:538 stop:1011 length:474 start_codon:yes stop_codon:yes gene_type:complete
MNLDLLYEEISLDEGKRLSPYLCSENHLTIGIGHKLLESDPESTWLAYNSDKEALSYHIISEERCKELFFNDIQTAIKGCERLYDGFNNFPQELQHILVNMVFQMGAGGVGKFKGMNKCIANKEYIEASEEMLDSRWARQTPNRAKRLSLRMAALEE